MHIYAPLVPLGPAEIESFLTRRLANSQGSPGVKSVTASVRRLSTF